MNFWPKTAARSSSAGLMQNFDSEADLPLLPLPEGGTITLD
jgi:hypothetical protein